MRLLRAGIYVGETKKKGRGIFTRKAIPNGTVIETAPVIIMSDEERQRIDTTLLHDYIFEWTPEDQPKQCCVALGWISLHNHSYRSNCEYYMDYQDNTMSVVTVRDIKEDEELTINYNGTWNDKTKMWFDVAK